MSKYKYEIAKIKIELDVFEEPYENLVIAEVEFESEEEANNFKPPVWFGEDVTMDPRYHNSNLSKQSAKKRTVKIRKWWN